MHRVRCLMIAVLAALLSIGILSSLHGAPRYSRGELDTLLSPIALYPDPLIAQILPAATYPSQLDDAAQLGRYRRGTSLLDGQDCDVSVKAVSHYPSVLNMMVNNPDW